MIEKSHNYCATIGFFDGVHRGHRKVIGRMQEIASMKGMKTMVITFDNHPMQVVRPGYVPELLVPFQEKLRRLQSMDVDRIETLHFTREVMEQTAWDFMKHVLRDTLGVRVLVIGYDNRFGKRNAQETFETYVEYGRELGIEVIEGPRPEECGLFEGKPVSSSLIRQLIKDGREDDARSLMQA